MKKFLLLFVPLLMIGAIGGAVWWKYGRARDPFTSAQKLMDAGDLKGAQLELRTAIRNNPNNAAAHFRLGQVHQRLGDPVAAEKELKTARDQGFEARLINPILAQTYMAQGRYRELVRDFNTQGLPPEQAAPLMNMRALAQLSLGDTNAAQASAADGERLAPQSIEAALTSARVALARRDYAGGELKVDRALQISPRSIDALLMKGQLQNVKGDRTRALEAFDSVIAIAPNMLAARLERANVLMMDGKDDRARLDVDAAMALEPRSSMGLYLRAVLRIKAEDYTGADSDLTKIASVLGRFPRGLFYYAIVKYNLGQAEQASDAANKFLARNATDADAVKLFSRIELAARRSAIVIRELNKAQEAGFADSDMLDLLARAYLLAGKPDLALQNMERAAALAPANADILTRLASLRLNLGDASRAATELERALELSPAQAGAAEQLVMASITAGEIDRAIVALEKLRKLQGETETVGNLNALIRMAQLDLDGATAQLEKTIAAFPDSVQPSVNLAKVLVLKNRASDAQDVLAEILERKPTEGAALSSLVGLLLAEGKTTLAVSRLEKARAAAPKDVDIAIGLANLYLRTNEARKGVAIIDELLKEQPGNTALITAKARVLVSLGQSADAQIAYNRVLEENPLDVSARLALADLLIATRDPDGARLLLAAGLKEDPGNSDIMQAMVSAALKAGGLDGALALADQLGRDPANMPAARWLRGDALMATGRFADAANIYNGDLRAEPSTAGVLRLVTALSSSGRADQSTQILRDWMNRNPDDALAADALAGLDLVARRFFEAEKQLTIVLRQRPSDPNALNNLAWVYQQRNDSRARAVAQKSYLLNPSPESADTLGWILVTTGNPAIGLALLRQANIQLPRDPTVAYHLAVAMKETGKRADAAKVLRPFILSAAEFDDRPAATRLLNELSQ